MVAAGLAAGFVTAAEPIRPASGSTKSGSSAASRPSATRGSAPRGVLPDPALLDGSALPAEKRPEFGMIGDFELPGDENARNDKAGGQQQGGSGNQPQGSGAGQPPPAGATAAGQSGGGPQIATESPDGQGAGGQSQQQGQGTAEAAAGAAGQNQAGGQQVASLQGEGGGQEQGKIGEKPPQVSIGDSAMQIKTVANAPSIVGGQQASAQTQQHEKTTGTGGKGPSGSNANKGVERGRAIPAGL